MSRGELQKARQHENISVSAVFNRQIKTCGNGEQKHSDHAVIHAPVGVEKIFQKDFFQKIFRYERRYAALQSDNHAQREYDFEHEFRPVEFGICGDQRKQQESRHYKQEQGDLLVIYLVLHVIGRERPRQHVGGAVGQERFQIRGEKEFRPVCHDIIDERNDKDRRAQIKKPVELELSVYKG